MTLMQRLLRHLSHVLVAGLSLMFLFSAGCCPQSNNRQPAQSFKLYYGTEARVLNSMLSPAGRSVLVWDSRSLKEQQLAPLLRRARAQNAISLGYISIGELAAGDSKRAAVFGVDSVSVGLDYNEKFHSWRVDVVQKNWSRWVLAETDRLAAAGFTGFFLDTPDTVDHYITHSQWNRAERGARVLAMIELVRAIKQRHPKHFVLLNRGLNLIGAQIWMNESGSDLTPGLNLVGGHPFNPDAVLYENAFASEDAWTLRIEADLAAIAHAGHSQIFALGYADTLGDRAKTEVAHFGESKVPASASARYFFNQAARAGFVAAFAESSTTLHLQPTQTAKELGL